MARNARLPLLLALLASAACAPDEAETGGKAGTGEREVSAPLPERIEIPDPAGDPLFLELVEDDSEEVANELIELADKVRRRDFRAAAEWFADGFAGHAFDPLPVARRTDLPLGAVRVEHDTGAPPVVGREAFLDSLAARIGSWKRVEAVVWKVKGAEFQAQPRWGKVRLKITLLGTGADGGPREIVAWAHVRAERTGGRWLLDRLALDSLKEESRSAFLFTDVSASAGVAHSGIRFGQPGNDVFAWSGAAVGDATRGRPRGPLRPEPTAQLPLRGAGAGRVHRGGGGARARRARRRDRRGVLRR